MNKKIILAAAVVVLILAAGGMNAAGYSIRSISATSYGILNGVEYMSIQTSSATGEPVDRIRIEEGKNQTKGGISLYDDLTMQYGTDINTDKLTRNTENQIHNIGNEYVRSFGFDAFGLWVGTYGTVKTESGAAILDLTDQPKNELWAFANVVDLSTLKVYASGTCLVTTHKQNDNTKIVFATPLEPVVPCDIDYQLVAMREDHTDWTLEAGWMEQTNKIDSSVVSYIEVFTGLTHNQDIAYK